MMHEWKIFALLSVLIVIVYFPAFFNFFAQDDFILAKHFSQNNLIVDIKNVFGPPEVTHWRPMHNLYFLIAGNIFGKQYFGYHLMTITLHILTCFFIFKISKKLFGSQTSALFTSMFYGIHPAHFISLFWISGGAITIGFFFLSAAVYCYLLGKSALALGLYFLSLLSSESLLVGVLLVYCITSLKVKKLKPDGFFICLLVVSAFFIVARLIFFTPRVTFDVYRLEFSTRVLSSTRYYLLRAIGFVEGYGKSFISFLLLVFLASLGLNFSRNRLSIQTLKQLLFGLSVLIIGLFPFVLIPGHLSPHYMSISIWGFVLIVGSMLRGIKSKFLIMLTLVFFVFSFTGIRLSQNNSWVVNRSRLAKQIIYSIEVKNPPVNTTLIFEDTKFASSEEQYVALGTGEAIGFWFKEKNYKVCFTFIDDCSQFVNGSLIFK